MVVIVTRRNKYFNQNYKYCVIRKRTKMQFYKQNQKYRVFIRCIINSTILF